MDPLDEARDAYSIGDIDEGQFRARLAKLDMDEADIDFEVFQWSPIAEDEQCLTR